MTDEAFAAEKATQITVAFIENVKASGCALKDAEEVNAFFTAVCQNIVKNLNGKVS